MADRFANSCQLLFDVANHEELKSNFPWIEVYLQSKAIFPRDSCGYMLSIRVVGTNQMLHGAHCGCKASTTRIGNREFFIFSDG